VPVICGAHVPTVAGRFLDVRDSTIWRHQFWTPIRS
jgi:hypothetical protein